MTQSSFRSYKGDAGKHSPNRRVFDILIIACIVLAILCGFLAVRLFTGSTSDTRLHDVLVEQARSEYAQAYEAASQLSRIGGSNTMRLLALTRQHIYGITQLNALSAALLDSRMALVPAEPLTVAVSYLDQCESRLQAGYAIDEPLNSLWETLRLIEADIQALV